jgi:hypothetical protein
MRRPPRPDAELRALPNVGPATAADLLRLGIREPEQLKGRDPYRMYDDLCRRDGVRHDPCLIDVFISIVEFAGGAKARPWWHFTSRRKKHLQSKGRTV